MKALSPLLLVGLLLTARPAVAGLDFTLQHKAQMTDAIGVDKTYITDGTSKIYLQIPGEWQVTSSAQGIDCVSDVSNSRVRLEKYQGNPLTIDEVGGRTLLQQITAQVPAGAKKVEALPAEYNPLPIFGWTDVEVAVRYEFFGQVMRRSMMYLNMLPGRTVLFSVTGPDADFKKAYRPARAILCSWFEPSRDLPPDLASKFEAGGMNKN